jgi:hypothetical protein
MFTLENVDGFCLYESVKLRNAAALGQCRILHLKNARPRRLIDQADFLAKHLANPNLTPCAFLAYSCPAPPFC